MSRENVEIVRRTIDFFNTGDVDKALEEASVDFEMDWSNSIGPLRGVYGGRQEVRKVWAAFIDAWETVQWEPKEIIDVDHARVIVVNRVQMRGRGSGVDVDATGVQLWTLAAGVAQRVKLYQSKVEALEAAGLSE